MKRTKFLIQSIFLTVLTCLTLLFASCTGKIEGTYKFDSMTYNQNGVSIEIKVGEKFMDMMTLSEDLMKLTLNEDGSAIVVDSSGNINFNNPTSSIGKNIEPEIFLGSWAKVDDKEIALTFNYTKICECNGRTIKLEIEGIEYVLRK